MSVIKEMDADGCTIRLVEHDGERYPHFPADVIRNIKHIKLRHDDVIVSAFPKSGSHWVHEITRLLQMGWLDETNFEKNDVQLEYVPEATYAQHPSPRILSSHLNFRSLPSQVLEKKCKIIYILRNPKDIAVSFYNFCIKMRHLTGYKGTWENFLPMLTQGKLAFGSWFDYVVNWEKEKEKYTDLPVLTLFYEDLKEDTLRGVKKINDFLDLKRDDRFLQQVCDHVTFANLKRIKGRNHLHDGKSVVFRKGEVGDWKNWFTVAQNEWFDQLFQEKMADCHLRFRYTLEDSL